MATLTSDRLVAQLAAHVCALSNDVLSELHFEFYFVAQKLQQLASKRLECGVVVIVCAILCIHGSVCAADTIFLFPFFLFNLNMYVLAITNGVTKACCLLFSAMFNRNVVEQK